MIETPTYSFQPLLAAALICAAVLAAGVIAYIAVLNRIGLAERYRRLATPALMVWAALALASCGYAAIVLGAPTDEQIAHTDLQAREHLINTYRVNPESPVFARERRYGPGSAGAFESRVEVSTKKRQFIVDATVEEGHLVLSRDGKELKRTTP